ncbi:hypothetical protein M9H77_23132 [Catharanthus roseus]|uniref:Uncharacterized protein n=1 Tax=Catharanthus roseus TaxID=4058 RepID=A0ACC0AUK9_CATRO|nr:hypothetical protein M9H77_23132 [Catharanthus roseus]
MASLDIGVSSILVQYTMLPPSLTASVTGLVLMTFPFLAGCSKNSSALASYSTSPWNSRGQNWRNRSRASSLLVLCVRFSSVGSLSSVLPRRLTYLPLRSPPVRLDRTSENVYSFSLGHLWLGKPDLVTKSSEKGEKTFERHERWTPKRNNFVKISCMQVINSQKGLGAARKSERIKTHRRSRDTRTFRTMHAP